MLKILQNNNFEFCRAHYVKGLNDKLTKMNMPVIKVTKWLSVWILICLIILMPVN